MTVPQPLGQIADIARRTQASGFSGLLFTETGRTAYLNAAVASQAAPGLELSTGVAVAFPRSPSSRRQPRGNSKKRPTGSSGSASAPKFARMYCGPSTVVATQPVATSPGRSRNAVDAAIAGGLDTARGLSKTRAIMSLCFNAIRRISGAKSLTLSLLKFVCDKRTKPSARPGVVCRGFAYPSVTCMFALESA